MNVRLLFVDDDDTFRSVLQRELEVMGYDVTSFAEGASAIAFLADNRVDVALLDLRLPGMDGLELLSRVKECAPQLPVVLLTGHGSFPDAVAAMRAGAFDFLGKPASLDELELALARAVEHGKLRRNNQLLQDLISREVSSEILGESPVIHELRSKIARIAPGDANVLILGESGTGKELVARGIHNSSPRREAAFVVVNCAAIPAELFESELFGHARGAFTGAGHKRAGLVALAEGGTLFLDEVADLPKQLQPALLRAVQFGEYRPVGTDHVERADLRVIAATNRELAGEIEQGEFREDLYHRIATIDLHVPPLRERGDDVLVIADNLLAAHNLRVPADDAKTFGAGARDRLRAHEWTGNVRELENVLVRLVTLIDGPEIEGADVDRLLRPSQPSAVRLGGGLPALDLEVLERCAVIQALQLHSGNRTRAAAELGVAIKTLYNKIRHHEILAAEWGG